MNQPFITNIGGQRMRCTMFDRAATAVWDGLIANGFAYAVNRFTGKNTIDRTGATVLGALAGATLMCDPEMVNDEPQQMVVLNQNQQETGKKHCDKKGESFAKLKWDGHPQNGTRVCMTPDDPHRGESLPE